MDLNGIDNLLMEKTPRVKDRKRDWYGATDVVQTMVKMQILFNPVEWCKLRSISGWCYKNNSFFLTFNYCVSILSDYTKWAVSRHTYPLKDFQDTSQGFVTEKSITKKGRRVNDYAWGQDGCILAQFPFFCAIFMERMEVEASKNVKKKTRRIFCDLDRTSFVGKVFIT